MQFKIVFTITGLLAAFASAVALPAPAETYPLVMRAGDCNSQPQCCNSISKPEDKSTSNLLKSLQLTEKAVGGNVATNCKPISGNIVSVDALSDVCASQTVCCNNNSFNGLIALGCIPIGVQV
ncbi:hypothetical protein AJ80_04377 [Polytolypa hystricis UAMH7299]|uniref:Hydrophobin n=1 Tax=Polytolypa hystricis (strain UAMH7299) TaxID=1447883 RepID=A0A2B7Y3P0_POLH7|nr:hypothetical protein AJ80_04377 [Polytolypa hystricis UAMH7299]